MLRLVRFVLALAAFCLASDAIAQSYIYDAGSPTYGVNIPVENGFINVSNGNLHMEFPLAQHPQRGDLKLNERLVYDSHFWKIGHYSNYYWWPDNVPRNQYLAAGWRFENGADTGVLTQNASDGGTSACTDWADNVPGAQNQYYNINWSWTDPSGTNHLFSGTYSVYEGSCIELQPGPETVTGVATDSSGYTLTATGSNNNGPTSITIRDNNGMQVYPQIADRYGNYWSADSSGNLIDDRGQTPVVVSYNGNQIFYDVLRQGGGRSRYTVTTVQVTPHTQFGQQAVAEYPNGTNAVTLNAVQSIQLPDGSSYQFQYENTFGMMTGVTLPTGGQITYGWSNYTDSYSNVNRWLTSRQAGSDPQSTFTPAVVTTCGSNQQNCHEKVTAHEPGGDETVYDMQLNLGAWNVNTQRFSGSAGSGGTLVSSTDTVYNNLPTCGASCASAGFITSQTVTTTLADTGLKRSDTYEYANNALGLLSAKKVYDFYTGNLPSQPIAQTQYTYAYTGVANDLSRLAQTDGAGNNVSFTDYTYTSSFSATSGLANHDVSQAIGQRLQTIKQWVNTDGSYLTTTLSMDDAGSVLSTADQNGTTTYGHDGTDTFVTSTTLPTPSSGVSISSSSSVDGTTGVPNSTTDANNTTTSYNSYDSLNRVGSIDFPDGGYKHYYRTATQAFQYIKRDSREDVTGTEVDAYGRASRTGRYNGQSSNDWYISDTCYNTNGQMAFQSLPYAGPLWTTAKVCSGAGVSYTYDALGRPTAVSNSDGTVQYSYRGRATKITDANNVQKISQVDGLGRLTSVCEITSQAVAGGSPADCGLDIAGTGYLTTYSYDLVNHTTTVYQGQQTRTFVTDSLGRQIGTYEPERGNTGYSYAYNGTGLKVTRTRNKANQPFACDNTPAKCTHTDTQYDSLGRVVSVSYDDGLTANKTFSYDTLPSALNWPAVSYVKGRLAATSTSNGTSTAYSYDLAGDVMTLMQCAPSICGAGVAQTSRTQLFNYDLAGSLIGSYDAGAGSVGYSLSPAGEVQSIRNYSYDGAGNTNPSTPYPLVSSVVNGPSGPISWALGNGLNGVKAYDSLGRNTGHWVCDSNSTAIDCGGARRFGAATGFTGSQSQGACDTVLNQCESHGYDAFNRLTSVTFTGYSAGGTTPPGSSSFTYDRWGNRTSNSAGPTYTFDQDTNHITGLGFSYDAAGNLLSDYLHNYQYDAEGKVLSVDGGSTATYTYNALDQRVRATVGGNTEEYSYNPFGQRVSTWNTATNAANHGRIYWNGTQIAFRDMNGQTFFEHPNWLGTDRLRTDYLGNNAAGLHSNAFGDGFQAMNVVGDAANDNNQYTGQDHDAETNTDHFLYRQYSPTAGRWMSPDPYNGSYDLSDPQSLNRYGYVNNNPFSGFDPTGLQKARTDSRDFDGGGGGIGLARITSTGFGFGSGWNTFQSLYATFAVFNSQVNTDTGGFDSLPAQGFSLPTSSSSGGSGASVPGSPAQQTLVPSSGTTCPAVPFKITGIAPGQATSTTAISQMPRAEIPNGGVAIKPGNFGAAGINGSNRSVFLGMTFTVDWSGTTVPSGIPTQGPFFPVDNIGPAAVRNAPGNAFDVYNYPSFKQAWTSTRTAMVTTYIPANTAGVKCPE